MLLPDGPCSVLARPLAKSPARAKTQPIRGVGVPTVACALDITIRLLMHGAVNHCSASSCSSWNRWLVRVRTTPLCSLLSLLHSTRPCSEYRTNTSSLPAVHPLLPDSLQPSLAPCFRVDMPPLKLAWRGPPVQILELLLPWPAHPSIHVIAVLAWGYLGRRFAKLGPASMPSHCVLQHASFCLARNASSRKRGLEPIQQSVVPCLFALKHCLKSPASQPIPVDQQLLLVENRRDEQPPRTQRQILDHGG